MPEYIPLEIQEEILKRLPTKPLLQFRTVSKAFKCLIDSPAFINSHSVHQPDDCLLLRYKPAHYSSVENKYVTFDETTYLIFVDNDDGFVEQKLLPTEPDLIKTIGPTTVVGSSHGLLCFTSYYNTYYTHYHKYEHPEMIVLWNPSIRKSIGIQTPYMYDLPNGNFCDVRINNNFGFGVCPVTFDPTIIKITCIDYKRKRNDIKCISLPWKVGVFTLSTGTWSILSINLPRESIRLERPQVVINRFIYWIAYDMLYAEDGRSQSQSLVMSFDLTDKEFKEINLPDRLANRRCRIETISKLRGSLVLIEVAASVRCLWMMKEQGVNRSFTKLYTIDQLDARTNKILGFRKTGDLILAKQKDYGYAEVEIYECDSEYVEDLWIEGVDFSFFMCSYRETLLLLDMYDGMDHRIKSCGCAHMN